MVHVTVLVVDDQTAIRDALSAKIDSLAGFTVIASTGSATEALRISIELSPDVVLFDILPEPTIFDRIAELASACPRAKVILIDDDVYDVHAQQALRLKAAGYLTKQQPFDEIETALRQALAGTRVYDPRVAQRLMLSGEGMRLAHGKDEGLASLTPREMDVLMHVARGCSVKQCAELLGISASTVDNHKSRLMRKLRVHKSTELARLAMHHGLLSAASGPCGRPHRASVRS
jgi:DNA-binding NarL/FixJ family response regulator